jgi:hypothetical protein
MERRRLPTSYGDLGMVLLADPLLSQRPVNPVSRNDSFVVAGFGAVVGVILGMSGAGRHGVVRGFRSTPTK